LLTIGTPSAYNEGMLTFVENYLTNVTCWPLEGG